MSNLSSGRLLCFQHLLFRTFSSASTTKTVPAQTKVFDRETKRRQRNWAASQPDFDLCRFMRDEFGYRIADKVFDLLKSHPVCIDLGCGAGHIGQHLVGENVRSMVQCDMSDALVRRSKAAAENEFPTLRLIGDEEAVPFRQECADLILSGCSAHWINNLPGWFGRCYQTLRPDGVLIGGILAGESLHQIRISLQLAEMERLGGLGAHISPFVEPQDIAALMNRAGFQMVTIDMDEILINYPNIFVLMHDLQLMAESNASLSRSANLKRETLVAADAIYRAMFSTGGQGDEKLSYPVTFQMVSFIGWRPGPNMPKTARRGSQNVSFKDVGKFIERAGEMGIKVEEEDEERPKKK